MKQVAVVEWNWAGHHPMQFSHFVLALEELGADVLAIYVNGATGLNIIKGLLRNALRAKLAKVCP